MGRIDSRYYVGENVELIITAVDRQYRSPLALDSVVLVKLIDPTGTVVATNQNFTSQGATRWTKSISTTSMAPGPYQYVIKSTRSGANVIDIGEFVLIATP